MLPFREIVDVLGRLNFESRQALFSSLGDLEDSPADELSIEHLFAGLLRTPSLLTLCQRAGIDVGALLQDVGAPGLGESSYDRWQHLMQKAQKFNERLLEFGGSPEDLIRQEPEWTPEPLPTKSSVSPLSKSAKEFLEYLAEKTASSEFESVPPAKVLASMMQSEPGIRRLAESRGLTLELLEREEAQNGA